MNSVQSKNEKRRLEVLWKYDILDTPSESAFDNLAELAAEICGAPIATITFVDENRQWFKAKVGLSASETSRDISFCAHAILSGDLLIVPDAMKDNRFANNPMVVGEPNIRFYAGAPLITSEGHALGALCIIDKTPRELSAAQQQMLQLLARHVVALLELRRKAADSSETRRIVKGKYQKIFDNALVGIFRTSPEGQYLEANPAIAQMLGYSSPQEVVSTLKDVGAQLYVDPNRRKLFRQVLESHGSVHDFQAEYFRKDGSKIWVKTTAQVVRDKSGNPSYYEGIIQEITAQISAENQLRESEAQYRTMFEGNPHPMWVFDQETMRFLEVNDAAIVHYGFSRDEFLNMTLRDIRPPEEIASQENYHQKVTRGEIASGLEQKRIWRHRKKDGTLIDVEVAWTPIQFQGRKASLVLANDITESKRVESALRETEEMFRLISENVSDLIAVVDSSGHRLYNSPSYKQIFRDPDALRGTDSFEQVHPDDQERVRAVFEETLRTGTGRRIEYRFLLPDGSIRHIESQGNFVRGETPQSSKVVVVSRDITERKTIENRQAAVSRLGQNLSAAMSPKEAARVIGETTRELFGWDAFTLNLYSAKNDVIDPVLNIDTIDGTLQEVSYPSNTGRPSPRERSILEQGPSLLLKQPPFAMLPDAKPIGDVTRPSASLLFVPIRNGTEAIGILSIQSYTPNAYTKQDLAALQTIADHCGGALERIRAEEALRTSEVRFYSVWENSVDGMRLTDENGMIVAVNKAFCDLVEMESEDLVGQPFTVTYASTGEGADSLETYQKRFRERDVPKFFERTMTFRSGKTAELQGANSFVDLESGRPLLLGLFRDVTEQKRLEGLLRQSQKMESIGQLAGGIAHDFNNLLTVIQGHTSLLLAAEKDGAALDSLQQISLASERSANLTRQLLTFSRRQIMQRRSLDLKEIVDEMTKMLRRILGEDIALKVENSANLPRIHADRGMMEQILLNLAVNSRDAMPRGGELHISTDAVHVDESHARKIPDAYVGELVCLTVRDTGSGIAPENLGHIFEPFFTTKEIGKGTGLGLATVYGIVKQHEGWVEVTSKVEKGTEFKIYFPRSREGAENGGKLHQKKMPRGSETILLVEDEAPLRELVMFLLERQGYRVLEACSGVAAVKVWEEHKDEIDLLLTDLVMPEGMTGGDLSKRLLAEDPNLKVIFTSGYSADIVGKDFVLRDGVNFLQKPYHPDKLAQTVRDCLDGKG